MTKESSAATQQIRDRLEITYDPIWDRLNIIWSKDPCLPEQIGPFLLCYSKSLNDFGGVSIQGVKKLIAQGHGRDAESEHTEYLPQDSSKGDLNDMSDLLHYAGRMLIHKTWTPNVYYFPRGDYLECVWENEPDYTDWIDHQFEVRRKIDGAVPGRIVGCRICLSHWIKRA